MTGIGTAPHDMSDSSKIEILHEIGSRLAADGRAARKVIHSPLRK